MRLRKKWWAKPEMEQDAKAIFSPKERKGRWQAEFGNDRPIHLELGCGKGQFISTLAERHPDRNYVAIDLQDGVLVYALRKVNEKNLANVRVVPMFIENVDEVFGAGEVQRIYINFCNPWPKKAHNKRRLTHNRFLKKYKGLLSPGSEIWFKTDDDELFESSLEYFKEEGFLEVFRTLDLSASGFEENIETEYEEKFKSFGMNIKFGIFQVGKETDA